MIKIKMTINVLIMLLVFLTLDLKAQRIIDELLIDTDGGYYDMDLDAQINIYDSSATGYPYTTNYSSFSINDTNDWKFNFVGWDSGPKNETVGYTVYKLVVHDNGEKIVYIDYRDCEYQNGDPNNNYNTADMYIRYFHNGEYIFETKNYSTGLYEPITNDTVKIWENGRKTPESSVGTSCFGIPDIPTNFNLTNYLGNPKLTWSENSEYDIDGYGEIFSRCRESAFNSLQTTFGYLIIT